MLFPLQTHSLTFGQVGVAATDVATGLYAHGAVMAALIGREKTGKGCWIDCNLFETQVAGLANIASNYLIAGQEAKRFGTAHPSVVPYQVFFFQFYHLQKSL